MIALVFVLLALLPQLAELVRVVVDAVRPLERLSPSEFAARYRYLKPDSSPSPDLWSNEVFPYLVAIMDVIEEAIRTGKKGVVLMKSAQGGGSEAMINALLWLLTYFPGPALYLISKDDQAKKFSKDRFGYAIKHCKPLAKKFLAGKTHGETIFEKRFTDAKLVISGGLSVLNLISNPYKIAFVDEADSLLDVVKEQGDPIKLVDARTKAYEQFGPTLTVAFAHPSAPERGVGLLYETVSDQRRGFIRCPHCGSEFWLDYRRDRKVIPLEGEALDVAVRNPARYHYVTPCCGCEFTDVERAAAVRRGVVQRSTLPAEEAARRAWIGVHFSALYMPRMPLAKLAAEEIAGLDKPSVMQVFVQKTLGEPWTSKERELDIEVLEALRAPEEGSEAYALDEVPADVQFLTAGHDSNLRELHWLTFGWGWVVTAAGVPLLRARLVSAGIEPGPLALDSTRRELSPQDLAVFDAVLYQRVWPTKDGRRLTLAMGFHDTGWQHSPVYAYCSFRHLRGDPRAVPSKGMADDDRSRHPPVRWSPAPTWRIGTTDYKDEALKRADLNTYMLKTDLFALPSQRYVPKGGGEPRPLMTLPSNVPHKLIEHLASERLVLRAGKRRWEKKTHENHWLDCFVLAYAAALQVAPSFMTADEPKQKAKKQPEQPPLEIRPEGWLDKGRRGGAWWQ